MAYRASQGQSLVEYGLILTLVSVVSIASLHVLGNSIFTQLSDLASTFGQASNSTVAVAGPGGQGLIGVPIPSLTSPIASWPDPVVAPGIGLPSPAAPSTGQASSGGCNGEKNGVDGNGDSCVGGSTHW